MGITYTTGDLNEINVSWLRFSANIPTDFENREITSIKVTAKNKHTAGKSYFDNFNLQRDLTNQRINMDNKLAIPLEAESDDVAVFGAVVDCYISSAHIVPEEDIVGDTNEMQLQLVKMPGEHIISTLTFVEGQDADAFKVTDFGPVEEDNSKLEQEESVKFVVENGDIPNTLLLINWNV